MERINEPKNYTKEQYTVKNILNDKFDAGIINYWWATANYGALLTGYALRQVLLKFNRSSRLIDNKSMNIKKDAAYKKTFNHKFAEKYLLTTKACINDTDFCSLNLQTKIFITGSDQVFCPKWMKPHFDKYFLNFTDIDAKKIAVSASFGVNKEELSKNNSEDIIQKMKQSLKSFDLISVREKSGVEICKDLFDVQAEWIIDPVFILEKIEYDKLIKNASLNFKDKIVSYVLDTNKNYKKAYKYFKNIYNTDIIETANSDITAEDWLSSIKNCKFLITDSFHGLCFAIIFNKPFICISNKIRGAARFESILEMLGIENQCISSVDEIYQKDCIFKVDYEKVNQNIEKERQKGLNFLNRALNLPSGKEKEKTECRMRYLENLVSDLEKQANLKYQIKKTLWELWLIIFHKFLPEPIKNLIRFIRDLGKCK